MPQSSRSCVSGTFLEGCCDEIAAIASHQHRGLPESMDMTTSLDQEPESESESSAKTPTLTPKIAPRWALKVAHIGVAAFFAVVFILFSYLPLRSTDLWGHTLFGHWILEHHALPTEDPFFPLAQGMQVVDSAWLSQVIFGIVDQYAGPNGLSVMFSLLVLATTLVLARTFFLQSQRLVPMLIASLAVLVVGWSRATTLRPECFGALLFAILLWIITRTDIKSDRESNAPSPRLALAAFWGGIPLLFCLWANLHGSYLVGLILLGCCALGKAIDCAWQNKSLMAALQDADVQRLAFVTEVALLATFINPYGWDLLIYNLTFARNVNLATVLEWQPLVILGVGGREFALSWVLLLFLWRLSKAPVTATQVLVLAVFSFASIKSMRMIGWYAPVYAWAIAPHVAEIWSRWKPAVPEPPLPNSWPEDGEYVLPPGRSFHFTLVTALVLWLGFSFSPLGTVVLGGKQRTPERLFDTSSSPLELVAYLQKKPPKGQVFQPQHWGDWLVREVPGYTPFVTSNIHMAPQQVWEDYLRITRAEPGWQRVLDRYNVTTLVLDKAQQPIIAQAMKQTPGWAQAYDDQQAVVYLRITQPAKPMDGEAPIKPADEQPGGESPDKLEGSKS